MQKNNFDFLRLIFSVFIIIRHSYDLTGAEQKDWIGQFSHQQASIAMLCFNCFFVMGGYMVFLSLLRSRNVIDFYWKRIVRIFPALFVVLLLTALYAQFVYEGSVPYLHNPEVWSYLPNNLSLVNLQYNIRGVFEHNPYPSAINGSLWSIPYEIGFCVLLSVLFFCRKNIGVVRLVLFIAYTLLFTAAIQFSDTSIHFFIGQFNGKYLLELGTHFTAGCLLASLNLEKPGTRKLLLGIGGALFVIALWFPFYYALQYIFIPLILIPTGLASTKYIRGLSKKIGDLSYGLYIYSFPVQQTLIYYFGLTYKQLIPASIAITFVLACFSWHVIEKRAMRLKALSGNSFINLNNAPAMQS